MRGGQSFGHQGWASAGGLGLPFLEKGSFDFFDRVSCPCPGLGVHVCVWGGVEGVNQAGSRCCI